ncbi:MAG: hypothetical protein U0U67_14600 [Chitinophagales bacterium]
MKNLLKNALLIVLFLTSCLVNTANSQTEKQTTTPKVPDMLQNADYVFEGTVVDSKGFPVTLELSNGVTKKTIFTSLLVQVEIVFKGIGMKQGLVQIIVEGGTAPSETDKNQLIEVPFYLEDDIHIPKFNRIGQKRYCCRKSSWC